MLIKVSSRETKDLILEKGNSKSALKRIVLKPNNQEKIKENEYYFLQNDFDEALSFTIGLSV